MSKNFELLHQIGKAQEVLQSEMAPSLGPAVPAEAFAGTPALEIDRKTREEVGRLVQRLFLAPGSAAPRHVVFTATESGDGCTWICARVGEILAAHSSSSVCIVDCNMRAPSLHHQFSVDNHYGLADALSGEGPIRQFVQQLSRPNLWLVSCGALEPASHELLTSERMRMRLSELRSQFDYVLLDVAAFPSSNHAMVFGGWCDGVVLVLKAHSTRRDATRDVTLQLQASNVAVLGAVLNQRTFPIPDRIYHKL
jgi:Mrp family chromosome partitioning ATPase